MEGDGPCSRDDVMVPRIFYGGWTKDEDGFTSVCKGRVLVGPAEHDNHLAKVAAKTKLQIELAEFAGLK